MAAAQRVTEGTPCPIRDETPWLDIGARAWYVAHSAIPDSRFVADACPGRH